MRKIIHKPWGREEWLELNDSYCYKRIYINAGYKTSFQYHNFKKETNYIIDGTAEIWLENDLGEIEKKIMKGGDFFNVTPPKKHRVIAITDLILQEVSTPEVDDVVRINDEFNRGDGKIEAEHNTPAVLILAAGLGSRLGSLTKEMNKGMLPINNKAIISHIIEKFPDNYDFIIAIGYKGNQLREYCKLAHPKHKFQFVEIDKYEGEATGPGYSTLFCKNYLQRPFYITTVDCLIDSKIPHIDGNWLAVNPTAYPEKYATVKIDSESNILDLRHKSEDGYEYAFIGLASIWNYKIFWNELESNIKDGELVSAFKNISNYQTFKVKHLRWFDTGNLDDLSKAKQHFNDESLSLVKTTGETVYKTAKFVKYNPNKSVVNNKSERAKILKNLIPDNFTNTEYFISYDWNNGKTIYDYNSLAVYVNFLESLRINLDNSEKYTESKSLIDKFYIDKTQNRISKFIERFGPKYYDEKFSINGKEYTSLKYIIQKLDITPFYKNTFYNLFHGDLQFANLLYNSDTKKYIYLDWRDSFADSTKGGDIYYDLAKLYGGCLIPYNYVDEKDYIKYEEGSSIIRYEYKISESLKEFKTFYEKWLGDMGYDLQKVKLMTGLIFLNMSPLHHEKFSKMLWFKSIEILDEFYR